ncbi:MAG: DUF58 domain-containing protein [Armatimonadota bacterium]
MDARDTIKNIKVDTGSLILNPRFVGPCLAGLFCLVVATVLNVTYLFTMATILLALPSASYIIGIILLRNCAVKREPLVVTTQGERASAAIEIECRLGRLPSELIVKDKLPQWVEAEDSTVMEVFHLQSVEIHSSFKTLRRGRYQIGPASLLASDPLGMLRLNHQVPGVTELIVHPRPIPFRTDLMASGNREFDHQNLAGRVAPRGGFAGVREYRSGDEFKRIHWKTTARTQRLSVMEFEDSTIGSVIIMFDLMKGCDYGTEPVTSLNTAAGAAAFALKLFLHHRRPARLVIPRNNAVLGIDVHSPGSMNSALNTLSDAKADSSLSAIDLVRSCSSGSDAILISPLATKETIAAVMEAVSRNIRLVVALVDPAPFGRKQSSDEVSVAELEQAGANVELIIHEARQ